MLRKLCSDVAGPMAARALQHYSASPSGIDRSFYLCSRAQTLVFSRQFSSDVKTSLLNASPRSLASDRVIAEPHPGVEQNFFTKALLKIGGFYTRESRMLRGARGWYQCVVEQAEDARLYKAFGLDRNFAGTYSLLGIHMWLCLVRLRSEGQDGKDLAQIVYENFSEDVEVRVRAAGVKVRISKHLTDLEQMFYGTSLSYDKALDGKEELSSAVLRNVYADKPERRKDAELLARELACLSMTDTDAVLRGGVSFSQDFLKV